MKKIKIYLTAVLFCGLTIKAKTINAGESQIINYKKTMVKMILSDANNNSVIKSKYNQNIKVSTYPTAHLKTSELARRSSLDWNSVEIDTSLGYGILSKGSDSEFIAKKIQGSSYYFYTQANIFYKQEINQLKMLKYGLRYSSNLFFIYFFKYEMQRNDLIGFYEKGKIHYIDINLHFYNNTEEILRRRYGSVQKFEETFENNTKRDIELSKIKDFKTATYAFRNDYKKWMLLFPNDTTKIFNLFISELGKAINLSVEQKLLLKERIYARIRHEGSQTDCLEIPFCGADIFYDLRSVLTYEDFERYIKYREVSDLVTSKSFNLIYEYLKNENHIPQPSKKVLITEDSIKEVLINEIMK